MIPFAPPFKRIPPDRCEFSPTLRLVWGSAGKRSRNPPRSSPSVAHPFPQRRADRSTVGRGRTVAPRVAWADPTLPVVCVIQIPWLAGLNGWAAPCARLATLGNDWRPVSAFAFVVGVISALLAAAAAGVALPFLCCVAGGAAGPGRDGGAAAEAGPRERGHVAALRPWNLTPRMWLLPRSTTIVARRPGVLTSFLYTGSPGENRNLIVPSSQAIRRRPWFARHRTPIRSAQHRGIWMLPLRPEREHLRSTEPSRRRGHPVPA